MEDDKPARFRNDVNEARGKSASLAGNVCNRKIKLLRNENLGVSRHLRNILCNAGMSGILEQSSFISRFICRASEKIFHA